MLLKFASLIIIYIFFSSLLLIFYRTKRARSLGATDERVNLISKVITAEVRVVLRFDIGLEQKWPTLAGLRSRLDRSIHENVGGGRSE